MEQLTNYIESVELMFKLSDSKKFRFERNYAEKEGFDCFVLMGNIKPGMWHSVIHLYEEDEHHNCKFYVALGLSTDVSYESRILNQLVRDKVFNSTISFRTNNRLVRRFKTVVEMNGFLTKYIWENIFKEIENAV